MAGGQERALRRRIKSVQSTKKITRAMELIAATRVVKAQERANAARPYSQQITNVILDLVGLGAQASHPLLRENSDANRSAFVVMTSDRGLCGAYNSAVIRAAERELVARKAEGKDYALVLIGKKANSYFKFRNYDIAASFYDLTDRPDYEDARAVSEVVRNMRSEEPWTSSTSASCRRAARRSSCGASCPSRPSTPTPTSPRRCTPASSSTPPRR